MLYMTTDIRDVEVKCVMIDARPSLNFIPLSILEATWVFSRGRIIKQTIEVSNFYGTFIITIGSINLELIVRPTRTGNRFHIFNARAFHHLSLKRHWTIDAKLSPPPTTNVWKPPRKGRKSISTPTNPLFYEEDGSWEKLCLLDGRIPYTLWHSTGQTLPRIWAL